MPTEALFPNDKLEGRVRDCIVFPSDGSETKLVPMIARTMTTDDNIPSLRSSSRCVDMTSTFGAEYRKTRVLTYKEKRNHILTNYIFFYNLSPKLPVNLNLAHLIGVTLFELKKAKRLFWRGDVVAMKVLPHPKDEHMVQTLDANPADIKTLGQFLSQQYHRGVLDDVLRTDKDKWDSYNRWPTSRILGAKNLYWGSDVAAKEENFLQDLNELRSVVGDPPLPPNGNMKAYANHAVGLFSTLQTTFGFRENTHDPRLPPELERLIFEIYALENPDACKVLVLVARRVYAWIDPIFLRTVCLVEDFNSKRRASRLNHFLCKLSNGQPDDYYAQHVKNLAFMGCFDDSEQITRTLTICSEVENLLLLGPAEGLDLLNVFGRNLRRLSIRMSKLRFDSKPNFNHPCFTNLTHLHIWDNRNEWPHFAGWETLRSLTHLAFASPSPEAIPQVLQKLPSVRYMVLGAYRGKNFFTMFRDSCSSQLVWGERVVFLGDIPVSDWERGARGQGDFWDGVEEEVERALAR